MTYYQPAQRGTLSDNYTWYHQEYEKRQAGQPNALDLADIKAAARGVRNSWSTCVKLYPKLFTDLLDDRPYDWQKITQARATTTARRLPDHVPF